MTNKIASSPTRSFTSELANFNHKVNASFNKSSEPIYEYNRQKFLEGRKRSRFVLILSTLVAITTFVLISLLQYDNYDALVKKREDYIFKDRQFCDVLEYFTNIDTITTPIGCILVLFYIVLFKRRSLGTNKYKYRNIGLFQSSTKTIFL